MNELINDWQFRVMKSQMRPFMESDGEYHFRIRYGDGKDVSGPCHDCGTSVGLYHIPGCDIEECPVCEGQLSTCGCEDDPTRY